MEDVLDHADRSPANNPRPRYLPAAIGPPTGVIQATGDTAQVIVDALGAGHYGAAVQAGILSGNGCNYNRSATRVTDPDRSGNRLGR